MTARFVVVALFVAAVAAAAPAKKPHEHGTLVVLLDRSGPMQGVRIGGAKAGAKAAIAALDPSDEIAVIAFDSEASVVFSSRPAGNIDTRMIDRIEAGGGTNIYPALKEAWERLAGVKGRKHVVVLTDGEAPTDGITELVSEMRDASITVSAIGIGEADRNLLQMIAENGEGVLYIVGELAALPKVMARDVNTFLPR